MHMLSALPGVPVSKHPEIAHLENKPPAFCWNGGLVLVLLYRLETEDCRLAANLNLIKEHFIQKPKEKEQKVRS